MLEASPNLKKVEMLNTPPPPKPLTISYPTPNPSTPPLALCPKRFKAVQVRSS